MAPSVLQFTILGQAASKANQRRLVPTKDGRVRSIKSAKALEFRASMLRQIPPACRVRMQGKVAVTLRMFYRTELPDMDESLVLDVLQTQWRKLKVGGTVRRELIQPGVYENDRQVRERHTYHGVDARNPRVEIEVRSLSPQMALVPCDAVEP